MRLPREVMQKRAAHKRTVKKSILEESFKLNFESRLTRAGFVFREQVKLPPARYVYDVYLEHKRTARRIYIEIDGHGFGHSSVASKKRDAEKGNLAIFSGAEFYRLTTAHFRRGLPTNYAHELVDRICGKKGREV